MRSFNLKRIALCDTPVEPSVHTWPAVWIFRIFELKLTLISSFLLLLFTRAISRDYLILANHVSELSRAIKIKLCFVIFRFFLASLFSQSIHFAI